MGKYINMLDVLRLMTHSFYVYCVFFLSNVDGKIEMTLILLLSLTCQTKAYVSVVRCRARAEKWWRDIQRKKKRKNPSLMAS